MKSLDEMQTVALVLQILSDKSRRIPLWVIHHGVFLLGYFLEVHDFGEFKEKGDEIWSENLERFIVDKFDVADDEYVLYTDEIKKVFDSINQLSELEMNLARSLLETLYELGPGNWRVLTHAVVWALLGPIEPERNHDGDIGKQLQG